MRPHLTEGLVFEAADNAPALHAPTPIIGTLWPNRSAPALITAYFHRQPESYIGELDHWIALNGLPRSPPVVLVNVPSYNEDERLLHLINQYAHQSGDIVQHMLVCVVVNAPSPGLTAHDNDRLRRSVSLLIRLRSQCPWLHILVKRFPRSVASLGRARKYGVDYCMRVAQRSNAPEAILVFNEADTVAISTTFLAEHIDAMRSSAPAVNQGMVQYPDYACVAAPLQLFLETRETVHRGQGLSYQELPSFGGIMPVGRNFATSAAVAAAVGGIDSARRPGTDDDINFGFQVTRLLGAASKIVSSIPLITHPRREALIVDAMCRGLKDDAKQSYEQFHENATVYSEGDEHVRARCARIESVALTEALRASICKQYFQWVFRSVVQESLQAESPYSEAWSDFSSHTIGYWDLVDHIVPTYVAMLRRLSMAERQATVAKDQARAFHLYSRYCDTIHNAPASMSVTWLPSEVANVI